MRKRSAGMTCTSLPCGHSFPDSSMNPPTWLDERGRPLAQHPCPTCGREIAVVTLPPEHLRFWGRQPLQLSGYVEWCDHRVEGIPVPDGDGCGRLIVVEAEAT